MADTSSTSKAVAASQAYAKGQQYYDETFAKHGQPISQHAQSSSLLPTPTNLEQLIPQGKTIQPHASFSPPPSFMEGKNSLFNAQLTSATGPSSSWEDRSQKILAFAETLPEDAPARKHLTAFVHQVDQLTKWAVEIKGKAAQYLSG